MAQPIFYRGISNILIDFLTSEGYSYDHDISIKIIPHESTDGSIGIATYVIPNTNCYGWLYIPIAWFDDVNPRSTWNTNRIDCGLDIEKAKQLSKIQ